MKIDHDDMELRGYRVHGRVQGVGFRWWTRSVANRLGLGGHVKNLSTGSVEIHVAGPSETLDRFEKVIGKGPPVARVTEVEEIPPDQAMSLETFEIGSR